MASCVSTTFTTICLGCALEIIHPAIIFPIEQYNLNTINLEAYKLFHMKQCQICFQEYLWKNAYCEFLTTNGTMLRRVQFINESITKCLRTIPMVPNNSPCSTKVKHELFKEEDDDDYDSIMSKRQRAN